MCNYKECECWSYEVAVVDVDGSSAVGVDFGTEVGVVDFVDLMSYRYYSHCCRVGSTSLVVPFSLFVEVVG